MKRKILTIRLPDTETLSLVAAEDHPSFASATVSLASNFQRDMAACTEGVLESQAQAEADEMMTPDVESLAVTELKYRVLAMHHQHSFPKILRQRTYIFKYFCKGRSIIFK